MDSYEEVDWDDEDLMIVDDDQYDGGDFDDSEDWGEDDFTGLESGGSKSISDYSEMVLNKHTEDAIALAQESGFACGSCFATPSELIVTVGVSVSALEDDLLAGCGLDDAKLVFIRLKFAGTPLKLLFAPPSSIHKTIEIRQTSDTDFNKTKFEDEAEFGLWWTLQERLTDWFKLHWNQISERGERLEKSLQQWASEANLEAVESILETLELKESSRLLVKAALAISGNDQASAIDLVLSPTPAVNDLVNEFRMDHVVPERDPYLVDVALFILDSIKDAPKKCIVCGVTQPLPLLKPVACSQPLCNFQQIDLGLGVSLDAELRHRPSVVDLLISLTYAATSRGDRLVPFPVLEASKFDKKSFTSTKIKIEDGDMAAVRKLLDKCPAVKKLSVWANKNTLRDECDTISILLYPLLRWIVATNKSHLKTLQQNLPITPKHQFVLKSTPPEKEMKFQVLKEKHGSFFAWHGSPIANWHAILRTGLKNMSGTKGQAHGQAYGPGIYLAKDSQTSLGYSRNASGPRWKHSIYNSNFNCIVLCEVINMGSDSKCIGGVHRPKCSHNKSAPYYRIEAEDCIVTRFYFVVEGQSFNTQATELGKKVNKHPEFLRMSRASK
eukprot:TRINITY_DN9006_c0_g1_i1.p1 TRINITY_DN9006_c0_g1~~TRINITY_DN9006_c0_g1_i1.p1  ORF type:complete len:621 (-),score=141.58 TRINITY_DN9006_c0_g1_i1:352-2187(-)